MFTLTDVRNTTVVELPSYPWSEIIMYDELTESQKRGVQRKYNHIMQIMMNKAKWWIDTSDEQSVLWMVGDLNIADLTEMTVYQWFLQIKSWNITKEDGNAYELTFENFDNILMEKDTAHLRSLFDKGKDSKKKETSEESSQTESQ